MQLKRLQLTNFRGFEHLDLTFHERLTVLVGVNGSGKSSVLDVVRLLLSGALNRALPLVYASPVALPSSTDIQEPKAQGAARMEAQVQKQPWAYGETWTPRADGSVETTQREAESIDQIGRMHADDWLTLLYGVRRALLDGDTTGGPPADPKSLEFTHAYRSSLSSKSPFGPFLRWFRAREDVENEQRLRGDPSMRDQQLQAVRRAITSMMPGYGDLFVQRHPRETMMLSKNGKKLSLNQLSDGEKCLLAMVGDQARRMAMLTMDEQSDPLDLEALVMIDEIELHLHPRWQREVVPRLLKTFPRTQFVLTTHSPQVLSSVAQESIVVLDDFKAYPATLPTKGRDSTSILVDLMGLPEHPRETAERLHRIALLLDEEKYEQARSSIGELAHELGEEDREVIRLRSLLGFLAGESNATDPQAQ